MQHHLLANTECEETFGRGVPISRQSNVTCPPTATLASSKTFRNSGCVNPARIYFGISYDNWRTS
ncbi:hypothetical protein T01_3154 [Trichinella spiralis]|uniref:Uncharacterized protein n=1 Tax=Trichinella spiralis TaxID=6334 RepID=A0A0V1B2V9_TRISP|nr:hypothetical protein T01_3154 [Trichinella spiralis]